MSFYRLFNADEGICWRLLLCPVIAKVVEKCYWNMFTKVTTEISGNIRRWCSDFLQEETGDLVNRSLIIVLFRLMFHKVKCVIIVCHQIRWLCLHICICCCIFDAILQGRRFYASINFNLFKVFLQLSSVVNGRALNILNVLICFHWIFLDCDFSTSKLIFSRQRTPSVWNSLSHNCCFSELLGVFSCNFKTELFDNARNWCSRNVF